MGAVPGLMVAVPGRALEPAAPRVAVLAQYSTARTAGRAERTAAASGCGNEIHRFLAENNRESSSFPGTGIALSPYASSMG